MPSFSSCAPADCSLFLKSEPTALFLFSAVHPTGCEEEQVFIKHSPDRQALHSSNLHLGSAGFSQKLLQMLLMVWGFLSDMGILLKQEFAWEKITILPAEHV